MRNTYRKTSLILLAFIALSSSAPVNGQVPEGFNYMAIARNGDGDIIKNTGIKVRIAILDADETVAWEEEHDVTTNDNGLFQLIVGDPEANPVPGGYEGSFNDIDWTLHPFFIRTKSQSGNRCMA